jgi:hypothetical protein
MSSKSLNFLLFGEDVTASKAFREVSASAEKSAAGIGGAFSGAGKALLGIGAVAAGLGFAAKQAGNFEQETNVLVTAAGESAAALEGIRKGILSISQETGTSWQQVTDGIYLLEKAGYRGAEALEVERAAAQGAREENASLATVTQAMTSIMASYHLEASDSVMVMNQLKTAAGESKTTMELFAGSLSTVLPVASANKISFADVAGSLATLTQHGTSADEATQELSNTIRNLAAPNAVAIKEMAQLGISSVDVAQKVGDGPGGRGLAGTLNYLSETVLKAMGSSGTVLLNTFNQSKVAAAAAATEFKALAPATQKLAQKFIDGTITQKDWTLAVRAMSPEQANLAKQFAATQNNAVGFQTTLKNGLAQNQTYSDAIKKMTGGVNGLNTTLQITGESMAGTNERIDRIAQAAKNAGKDVDGWESTQKLFNVQLDRLKASAAATAITVGTDLLPPLTKMAEFVMKNKTAVELLVGGLVLLKTGMYAAALASAALELASGPVILGIAALAAGFTYAYQNSATFREAVQADMKAVAVSFNTLKTVFKDVIMGFLNVEDVIISGAAKAFGWIPGLGPNLRAAKKDFDAFRDQVNDTLNGIATPKPVSVDPHINTEAEADTWRHINGFKTRVEVPVGPVVEPPANATVHQVLNDYKTRIQVPIGPIVDQASAADVWRQLNNFKTRIQVPVGPVVSAPAGVPGGNASGTDYWRGGPTTVNEQGNEIIDLPTGTRIHTASASKGVGGGDISVVVHVAGSVRSEKDLSQSIISAIDDARRRRGGASILAV